VVARFDGFESMFVLRARHTDWPRVAPRQTPSSRLGSASSGSRERKASQKDEAVRVEWDWATRNALVEVFGANICSASSGLSEARLRAGYI
jgi:hypothetical protein